MSDNKSNITGLYFEDNMGVFNRRTVYPKNYNPDTDTKFMYNMDYNSVWTEHQIELLFWNGDMIDNPFVTNEFYYAEINHPTMGKAIYRKRKNNKYIWQFENEKDVKISMRSSFGDQYKDMLNDGYIVIKKGHNKITPD